MSHDTSNKRERAVALEYKDAADLPRITASGVGRIATRIIEIAREHNIPIQEHTELNELLAKLPSGSLISPESYRLMAEVICFLYHADAEFRSNHSFLAPTMHK